ncbi:MAG: S-layer homology domain-containing protein [Tissierellia bacterium]|nr:S-layer homology domain-containing protein [Tissierellia bacterium]
MAYIFGYPEGTVMPNGNMTRAEAAAMISRLKNYPLADSSEPKFTDTPSGWYNAVINAVVKAGVMKGYPDGSFKPQNPITRGEFAQMLMPIDVNKSGTAPFDDVKGHWAEKAINQAYANGRIQGYPDGTFKPNNPITRAEAATILNRMFERKVTEEGMRKHRNEIHKFTDLTTEHWGYYELVEAANSHVYVRMRKGAIDERWIELIK